MAHSITYWYDIMEAERQSLTNLQSLQPNIDSSQQLLTDLSTTSKVGRWRLMMWVVATAAYALEIVYDLFKVDLEEISSNSRYGTLPWYSMISLYFQYGYTLVWIGNNFEYATIDDSAKIVKRVSAQEAGSVVNLKVAKLNGTSPEKLNATEIAAFESYINEIRPAGINVNIISDDPDYLKLSMNIKRDPLVLAADGELLSSPGTYPVNDAINEFIGTLPFDGVFELCDLVDAVQDSEGVKAAYVNSCEAKYGAYTYSSFTERYTPNAGYLTIDPSFPLSNSINYNV